MTYLVTRACRVATTPGGEKRDAPQQSQFKSRTAETAVPRVGAGGSPAAAAGVRSGVLLLPPEKL